MGYYFEGLKSYYRNDYLTKQPRVGEVKANANVEGNVSILPESNNRAIVIDTPDKEYLQSYDTLILETDKTTGQILKLWDGYSATTMKHIDTYLNNRGCRSLGKKAWEAIGLRQEVTA